MADNKVTKGLRTVKSFMRRASNFTEGRQTFYDLAKAQYLIDLSQPLPAAFLKQPIILDIGFGMGQSTVELAKNYPNYHIIGIEVHKPGIADLAKALQRENLSNVLMFEGDVHDFLKAGLTKYAGVHILFSDPWQKKRHHKRRLLQTPFFDLLNSHVATGGYIHIATDWQNYAEHIDATVGALTYLEQATVPLLPNYVRTPTKFESRALKIGRNIYEVWLTTKV